VEINGEDGAVFKVNEKSKETNQNEHSKDKTKKQQS
jgi:hypothetical protein